MTSRTGRLAVLAAFVVVAAILFVVLQEGDSGDEGSDTTTSGGAQTAQAPPPEPPVEVIEMRDGAPVGGVRELTYSKGDEVRIRVKLDVPQEDVHIHGYEIEKLNVSGTVSFNFPATIEGIFELEAHGPSGDVALAEIRVDPA